MEDNGSGTIGGCNGDGNRFADCARVVHQFTDRVLCFVADKRESWENVRVYTKCHKYP